MGDSLNAIDSENSDAKKSESSGANFLNSEMLRADSEMIRDSNDFEINSVRLENLDSETFNARAQKLKLWVAQNRLFLGIGTIAVVLLMYAAFLLFGGSSLQALLRLQDQRDRLKNDVDVLQKKNANIQKEIFELKGLEPK